MKLSRYHACVFRASVIFLVCVVAFGLLFALLPSGPDVARSGVTLQGVKFSLYPEQDQGAVWRFQARQVSIDPLKDENRLDDLGKGERWVKQPDGSERLDLTLKATQLVIDAQDNLKAQQADLYILQDCTSLSLKARAQTPVIINQRSGYSAPSVGIASPALNAEYDDVTSNFDFKNFQGTQRAGATVQSSPDTVCRNGRVVSRPS